MNLGTQLLIGAVVMVTIAAQYGSRRANAFRVLGPLAAVAYFGFQYLHGIPTAGNDVPFALIGVASGAVLGAVASRLIDVRREQGALYLVGGIAYVALWAGFFAARVAFAWGAENIFGHSIGVFSYEHHITADAWVSFFILQALAMVAVRTLVVAVRLARLSAVRVPA